VIVDKKKYLKLLYEKQIRKRNWPTQFFVPNRGQSKLFNVLKRDNLPMITAFLAGNGVGKTCSLVQVMAGLAWPDEALNPEWMGKNPFFKKYGGSARGRPLRCRLVCHVDDMKEGGSLRDEIVQWFPPGRYSIDNKGKTYGSVITCDSGVTFSVRTFDQSLQAHAGPNMDVILVNEPMPGELHGENVGRLRAGQPGMMIYFMTPLGVSAWMYDQIVEAEDDINTVVVTASIWDNCKDIEGTNGILDREKIEAMIREWEINDPDEAHSRITGEFRHLSGRVFKVFDKDAHVVDDFEVPTNWNIYRVLDPHDKRPPAIQWWAVDPMNNCYCVAEYPEKEYVRIKDTSMTYDHFATEIKKIDARFSQGVMKEIMDPNRGLVKTRQHGLSVKAEYNKRGFKFKTDVNDDLDIGHKRIQELLYYDNQKEISDFNKPKMFFFRSCHNSHNAIRKYAWKNASKLGSLTANIDQTYKDFVDTARYFAVSLKPWKQKSKKDKGQAIKRRRIKR
jgi:hypothetical protein